MTEHEMDVWGGWVRIFLLSVMWILIRTGLSIMGGLRDSNPHIENAGTCPRGIITLQNEGFFNQVSNQLPNLIVVRLVRLAQRMRKVR